MYSIGRLFLISTLLSIPFFVSADEKIVVTPAFQELTLEAGQTLQSGIEIKNETGTNQQFFVRSVSFQSLDTSGGVAFLGTDINNDNLPPAHFIILESQNLDVPAGETKTFPFQIRDAETVAPGGHYAALIFQSLPVSDEDSSEKIAVRQIFSSLIFLEKKGGEKKELQLKEIPSKRFLWAFPKTTELSFTNTGNTHLVPRGIVQARDAFGRIGARSILNEASSFLLPGQERVFPVTLKYEPWLPGRYTLEVSYRYDGKEEMTEIKEVFFLFPYRFMAIIGIVALLLIVLIKKGLFFSRTKL